MQWYYVKDGAQAGPVSADDFSARITSGEITGQTLVWNETMKDWLPYAKVSKSPIPPLPTASSASQIKETSEIPGVGVTRYAGFWIRFAALFIDGIILYVINFPIGLLFGLLAPAFAHAQNNPADAFFWPAIILLCLVQMTLPALYSIFMVGKYGATLGKKAVGIKVVLSDGSPVSYGRATGRYFAYILSGLILNIGYIMAGFDDEKRALHDRICDTRVIYKRHA